MAQAAILYVYDGGEKMASATFSNGTNIILSFHK